MKLTKGKIIAIAAVAVVLAAAFWYGGSAPGMQGWTVKGDEQPPAGPAQFPPDASDQEPVSDLPSGASDAAGAPGSDVLPMPEGSEPAGAEPGKPEDRPADEPSGLESRPGGTEGGMSAEEKVAAAAEAANGKQPEEPGDLDYSQEQGMDINPATVKDRYMTDPVPEGRPVPVEPDAEKISDVAHTCTLSVRCDTILDNMSWLDPEKAELVPEDGVIFAAASVTFYEGESVFNVLQREMKKAGIHMEFANTLMYNSAYIEGINNLYEFDCGELSGWLYKVNDWFPNYGSSRYQLQDGDVVEWVYTCNLGVDVGGAYSAGN